MFRFYYIVLLFIANMFAIKAQYISEVLEYKPAPGQFINSAPWGIPNSANSIIGGVTGSMSLGAFGGYVIFNFENPVDNHPDNPYGVDFTIFGNPLQEWSEQGVVSVMKDENANGLPDDIWYELAGSDYFFTSTIIDYEITYTNPNDSIAVDIPWSDNKGNSGYVLVNSFHSQVYYPHSDSFPEINTNQYSLSGTRIEDAVDRANPTYIKSYRKPFGYVDNQLRGSEPYTLPDNPYTPEKENSGGDAFDISWAVDASGNYVELNEIHFVKVHNAVLADAGWLGEVSTEVTGAVDVEPDNSISGILDMIVIKDLPDTIKDSEFQIEAFAYHLGRWKKSETINWSSDMPEATIDEDNLLVFSKSGELRLTASLADKPEITAIVSTVLEYDNDPVSVSLNQKLFCFVYPNPASDFIIISGADNVSVIIYSITGEKIKEVENYANNEVLDIGDLPDGIFVIHIRDQKMNANTLFIKE